MLWSRYRGHSTGCLNLGRAPEETRYQLLVTTEGGRIAGAIAMRTNERPPECFRPGAQLESTRVMATSSRLFPLGGGHVCPIAPCPTELPYLLYYHLWPLCTGQLDFRPILHVPTYFQSVNSHASDV